SCDLPFGRGSRSPGVRREARTVPRGCGRILGKGTARRVQPRQRFDGKRLRGVPERARRSCRGIYRGGGADEPRSGRPGPCTSLRARARRSRLESAAPRSDWTPPAERLNVIAERRSERTIFHQEHLQFRESVRGFVERHVLPNLDRYRAERRIDRNLWLVAG